MSNIFQELKSKLHDEDFEPRSKCEPTAATVAMEFEKAKYINRLYHETVAARQQARRAKAHG
jgi:hypothetical protein